MCGDDMIMMMMPLINGNRHMLTNLLLRRGPRGLPLMMLTMHTTRQEWRPARPATVAPQACSHAAMGHHTIEIIYAAPPCSWVTPAWDTPLDGGTMHEYGCIYHRPFPLPDTG